MAQSLALSGTSAQIIYLPTASLPPVIQVRVRGRLPNSVASMKRVRRAHRHAAYLASESSKEIAIYREQVEIIQRMLHAGRYQLIQAQQTAARLGVAHG